LIGDCSKRRIAFHSLAGWIIVAGVMRDLSECLEGAGKNYAPFSFAEPIQRLAQESPGWATKPGVKRA